MDIPTFFKGKISDVKLLSLSDRNAIVEYSFEGSKTTIEVPVRIHKTRCNNCTKIARGYFESIIQIRGDEEWVANMKEELERALHNTFITKEKEYRYSKSRRGIDLYVGSTRTANEAFKSLGLKAKKSNRLHTEKDGRKLYRMTYLLRQPEPEERRFGDDEERGEQEEE
jgi:nonsense-mediated mRNA decay protein 3